MGEHGRGEFLVDLADQGDVFFRVEFGDVELACPVEVAFVIDEPPADRRGRRVAPIERPEARPPRPVPDFAFAVDVFGLPPGREHPVGRNLPIATEPPTLVLGQRHDALLVGDLIDVRVVAPVGGDEEVVVRVVDGVFLGVDVVRDEPPVHILVAFAARVGREHVLAPDAALRRPQSGREKLQHIVRQLTGLVHQNQLPLGR